jgi:hypothetical protein
MTDGLCGVVCNSRGVWGYSAAEHFCIFPSLGLHFVRFDIYIIQKID